MISGSAAGAGGASSRTIGEPGTSAPLSAQRRCSTWRSRGSSRSYNSMLKPYRPSPMPDRIRPGRFSPATVVASRVSPSSNSRRIRSAGVVGSQTQPFIERQSASIWPCRVGRAPDPALARSEVAAAARTGVSATVAPLRPFDGMRSSDKATSGAPIPGAASSPGMTGIAITAGCAAAAPRCPTAKAGCSGAAAPFRATAAVGDCCWCLSCNVLAIQPSDSWR